MSGAEVLLIALAILVPLAIAIAVTLWTLQPAVLRNERARRSRRSAGATPPTPVAETPVDEVASHPG